MTLFFAERERVARHVGHDVRDAPVDVIRHAQKRLAMRSTLLVGVFHDVRSSAKIGHLTGALVGISDGTLAAKNKTLSKMFAE